jgi:hypothetical protein
VASRDGSSGSQLGPAQSLRRPKGVRLGQTTQVGPRIPVGIRLQKAAAGPVSEPTRRGARLFSPEAQGDVHVRGARAGDTHLAPQRVPALAIRAPGVLSGPKTYFR